MLPTVVSEKLESLPTQAGVYLFKDAKGEVLYVGKAKCLRNRVRSYFQASSSDTRMFIPVLQRVIGDLETIVTASEKEAIILENTLIKEHRPRYNVKLRDDKEYLSLRLDTTHPFPRLSVVRRPKADGAKYFGPYHSATAARRTLHLINKHFQLRTCTDTELASRKRPCLQYQIKRCPAPCVYEVNGDWYAEQVRTVALFLVGRHEELRTHVEQRMKDAARALRFELAALYRDQLRAIEKVQEGQRVVSSDAVDRDVLGIHREGDLAEVAVLHVRAGKLAQVLSFPIKRAEIPEDEILSAFLAQYYGGEMLPKDEDALAGEGGEEGTMALIPPEIVLPEDPEGIEGIAEWLTEKAGHKVNIVCPKRGARSHLVVMAMDNARHAFAEKRRAKEDVEERLRQMQERLRLPTLPRRIECCDISHLGGGDTVGAIVAMRNGELDKKRYRTFHVLGIEGQGGPQGDDYAAMYEVLARRFRRGLAARAEQEKNAEQATAEEEGSGDETWDLPDLFVVDGGRGQLAVAQAAAHDLGLHDLPLVGLAKERETVGGETVTDRVYLPGQKNPIPLKSHSASLFLLAMLRDEAHRSSNRGREIRGSSRRFHSALDDIRGLGPVARTALRKHLGTVEGIRKATDEEILAVPGINRRHLRALRAAIPAPELGTELTSESAESRDAGETEVLPEVSSSTKME